MPYWLQAAPLFGQRNSSREVRPRDIAPKELKDLIDQSIVETREAIEDLKEGKAAAQIGGDNTLANYIDATIVQANGLLNALEKLRRDFDRILKDSGEAGIDQRLTEIRNRLRNIADNYFSRIINQMKSDLKWVFGEKDRQLREQIVEAERDRADLYRKIYDLEDLIAGSIIGVTSPPRPTPANPMPQPSFRPQPQPTQPTPSSGDSEQLERFRRRELSELEAELRRLRRQELQMRVWARRFPDSSGYFLNAAEEVRQRMEETTREIQELQRQLNQRSSSPVGSGAITTGGSMPTPPQNSNPGNSLETRIRNLIDDYNRRNPTRPVRYTRIEIIPQGGGAIVKIYTGRGSFFFFNYYGGMSDNAIMREILRARNY